MLILKRSPLILSLSIFLLNVFSMMRYKEGDIGNPYQSPLLVLKKLAGLPLTRRDIQGTLAHAFILLINLSSNPKFLITWKRKGKLTLTIKIIFHIKFDQYTLFLALSAGMDRFLDHYYIVHYLSILHKSTLVLNYDGWHICFNLFSMILVNIL